MIDYCKAIMNGVGLKAKKKNFFDFLLLLICLGSKFCVLTT